MLPPYALLPYFPSLRTVFEEGATPATHRGVGKGFGVAARAWRGLPSYSESTPGERDGPNRCGGTLRSSVARIVSGASDPWGEDVPFDGCIRKPGRVA
jgi:hypothetical protein